MSGCRTDCAHLSAALFSGSVLLTLNASLYDSAPIHTQLCMLGLPEPDWPPYPPLPFVLVIAEKPIDFCHT